MANGPEAMFMRQVFILLRPCITVTSVLESCIVIRVLHVYKPNIQKSQFKSIGPSAIALNSGFKVRCQQAEFVRTRVMLHCLMEIVQQLMF